MVDVSAKESTHRVARASCLVRTSAAPRQARGPALTPDVILSARLAGIHAAKRTADVIPLCHPLALSSVRLEVEANLRGFAVTCEVVTDARTGVEMEALTACSFAALVLVDSLVASDPDVRVEDLTLLRKSGGKSGVWGRDVPGTH